MKFWITPLDKLISSIEDVQRNTGHAILEQPIPEWAERISRDLESLFGNNRFDEINPDGVRLWIRTRHNGSHPLKFPFQLFEDNTLGFKIGEKRVVLAFPAPVAETEEEPA